VTSKASDAAEAWFISALAWRLLKEGSATTLRHSLERRPWSAALEGSRGPCLRIPVAEQVPSSSMGRSQRSIECREGFAGAADAEKLENEIERHSQFIG
jgi:hypothetical protein